MGRVHMKLFFLPQGSCPQPWSVYTKNNPIKQDKLKSFAPSDLVLQFQSPSESFDFWQQSCWWISGPLMVYLHPQGTKGANM